MISALIVEDEELSRRHLISMLAAEPEVTIAGEAADGLDALKRIAELQPDVVFLDVEMPAMDGFGVVENLATPPLIVFVTAFDYYAVRAFEASAIDYLLKPVQPDRLRQALSRVRSALSKGGPRDFETLHRLVRELRPSAPSRLAARKGPRILLVPVRAVLWAGVEDRLVFLHTAAERLLTDRTLSELAQMLGRAGFFRISRAELVNTEHIRELIPWSSGTWRLSLTNGAELAVSRERAKELKSLVGL